MPRSRCLEKAITVWGWTFDLFTVAINITDVVSDVLVAVQFYDEGHMTWFWLVVSSLILSNIIYSMCGAEIILEYKRRSSNPSKWLRPLLWVLVFPFAQLAPTLNWAMGMFGTGAVLDDYTDAVTRERYDQLGGGGGSPGTASAAAAGVNDEAAASVGNQMHVMASLEVALKKHFKTHLLFYVETMVESIPQSVIQLLAITFLGQASSLQVFSMSLSLISIVSKAYVVSHSFTIKTMVFKFMLVAHDLFSLFYIFSTLLSKDEPADVELGSLHFNYMSYIWVLRMFVYLCCGCVGSLIVLSIAVWGDMNHYKGSRWQRECGWKVVGRLLVYIVVGILGAAPAVLAAEGGKLVWIILYLRENVEPGRNLFPHYSYLYTFVQGGDWAERMKCVLAEFTETYVDVVMCQVASEDGVISKHRMDPLSGRLISQAETETNNQLTPEQREGYFKKVLAPYGGQLVHDVRKVLNGGIEFDDSQAERDAVAATPYVRGSVCRTQKKAGSMCLCREHDTPGERIVVTLITIAVIIYTIGQLFSFFFPFINYGMNYHHQNLLQHFCFIAMAVSLLLVILLIPSTASYYEFCNEIKIVSQTQWAMHGGDHMPSFCKRVIRKYHVPAQHQILMLSVPFTILPPDIIGVVNSLLEAHSLDLSTLSSAECRSLKDRWDAADNTKCSTAIDIELQSS